MRRIYFAEFHKECANISTLLEYYGKMGKTPVYVFIEAYKKF